MEHGHSVLFHIGSFGVTNTIVTAYAITIIVLLLAFISTRKMSERPKGAQNAAEKVVEMLLNFLEGVLGPDLARYYLPYLGTLFIFILLSNYSGLLPFAGQVPWLAAPSSSLSFTVSLAVCTFIVTHYTGFHKHKLGYLKHFTKPMAFMLPLLLLEEFIRPLSLSLRLYGNIFGEEAVTHEIFNLVPFVVPIALQVLSLLLGFVQAMVFVLLSCIYIEGANSEGH